MTFDYVKYELIFNRKDKFNKQGKALVQVRAYSNGRYRLFSTNIYISESEWNDKRKEFKDSMLNTSVAHLLNRLRNFEINHRNTAGSFSLSDFDLYFVQTPTIPAKPKQTFTDFYKTELEQERPSGKVSWPMRRRSLELLTEFRSPIALADVNYTLIREFEFFLERKNLATNTRGKHIKHLRRYIRLAVKTKLIPYDQNPFLDYTIKTAPTKRNLLTPDEIERFEAITFEPTERLMEKVRDMFLFSCFTGIRISDMLKLKKPNFTETADGLKLDFKAEKTGKFAHKNIDTLFYGKPETIARKYIPANDTTTLFKGVTNPKANKELKVLAKRANINKAICYKDSRNTFANELAKVAPIALVQYEMQHSSLATTNVYFIENDESVATQLKAIKWKK